MADFDPYGMPCDDSPDPVECELEILRAELHELEARVARMQAAPRAQAADGEFRQNDVGESQFVQRDSNQSQNETRQPAAE
jgi:hypothetical protein